MRAARALECGLDQVVHLLAAARARPIVAEPEHVGGPQHDQLETVGRRIGFEDQLLGALEVAVAAGAAARKILGHAPRQGRRALVPAVIDRKRAQMHQPAHAGEPHGLGHVAGAAEIDVEGEAERLLHARADEAGGMHQRVDPIGSGDLDQGRQIAYVVARQREAAGRRASCAGNPPAAPDRRTPPLRRARCAQRANSVPIRPAPVTRVVMV